MVLIQGSNLNLGPMVSNQIYPMRSLVVKVLNRVPCSQRGYSRHDVGVFVVYLENGKQSMLLYNRDELRSQVEHPKYVTKLLFRLFFLPCKD